MISTATGGKVSRIVASVFCTTTLKKLVLAVSFQRPTGAVFCAGAAAPLWLAALSPCVPLANAATATRADLCEVKLAENGKALLPINVGPEATERARAAAMTLAGYLGRIAGAEFAVREGDGAEGIVVGLPGDFAKLPFDIAFEGGGFGREGYLQRSTEHGLYLLGATELAVEHAVWDTLYRLGYRQFFPGETWEIVPERESLSLAVNSKEKPDFFARRIWYNWGLWDYNRKPYTEWCARNRAVQGFRLNSGHSYGGYIRENKTEFDKHPEYFALIGGKRNVGAQSKLCISNFGLRKLIVDTAVRRFQKNPDMDSISVDPSDGAGWCECEQCEEMGSVSDRALTLANEVAAAINELGLGDKYTRRHRFVEWRRQITDQLTGEGRGPCSLRVGIG